MWDDPDVRYRADESGDERRERRPGDWSDLEGRPALTVLPGGAATDTPAAEEPSPAVVQAPAPIRSVPSRRLADFDTDRAVRLLADVLREREDADRD